MIWLICKKNFSQSWKQTKSINNSVLVLGTLFLYLYLHSIHDTSWVLMTTILLFYLIFRVGKTPCLHHYDTEISLQTNRHHNDPPPQPWQGTRWVNHHHSLLEIIWVCCGGSNVLSYVNSKQVTLAGAGRVRRTVPLCRSRPRRMTTPSQPSSLTVRFHCHGKVTGCELSWTWTIVPQWQMFDACVVCLKWNFYENLFVIICHHVSKTLWDFGCWASELGGVSAGKGQVRLERAYNGSKVLCPNSVHE